MQHFFSEIYILKLWKVNTLRNEWWLLCTALKCLNGYTCKYLTSGARMCLIISPYWKSWTGFLLRVTNVSLCAIVAVHWILPEKYSLGLLCWWGPHHFTAVGTYLQLLPFIIKVDISYMNHSLFIQHEQRAKKMDERFTGRKQLKDKNVKCYAASCVQLTRTQIYTLFQSKPFIR